MNMHVWTCAPCGAELRHDTIEGLDRMIDEHLRLPVQRRHSAAVPRAGHRVDLELREADGSGRVRSIVLPYGDLALHVQAALVARYLEEWDIELRDAPRVLQVIATRRVITP